MKKELIFYGAGSFAKNIFNKFIENNYNPVCFADADINKHYKTIKNLWNFETDIEILPLNEAIERYPDYEIIILVGSINYKTVYDNLILNGIPSERIGKLHSSQSCCHCDKIGYEFILDGNLLSCCCLANGPNWSSSGDIIQDLKTYYLECNKLRNDLNEGKPTTCAFCSFLQPGKSEKDMGITFVNLSTGLPGGDKCNFKCIYCSYGSNLKGSKRKDSIMQIMQAIIDIPTLEEIHYANGEITVSPYRNEILTFWKRKKLKGFMLTNASIFNEEIASLLELNLIRINVSLDAGTSETFKRIKQVDCFSSTVENLFKYANKGGKDCIFLKYILLPGINTNENDICHFIDIANELNAKIIISKDNGKQNVPMSAEEYSALKLIVKNSKEKNISYELDMEWFLCDAMRLKNEFLIDLCPLSRRAYSTNVN
jgi:pyruvate-formate lyase-activating enzyme